MELTSEQAAQLLFHEHMVWTVCAGMLGRGVNPGTNMTTVLMTAIERLTGELAGAKAKAETAADFASTWSELLPGLPDDYGCHMTCAEANAAAALFRTAGLDMEATLLLSRHAGHDRPGDEHYREEQPEPKPELVIDPDCRDGKCGSCIGGPCEHECHSGRPEAR